MNDAKGIAVVTGAGAGLGRAMAERFVAQGWQVAGLGPRAEALAETAESATGPGRFYPFVCDISDYHRLRDIFTQIRKIAPVSILVNNAAIFPDRDFMDETPESFMATISVNLGGMMACSRLALDDMVRQKAGRILNVSSFADLAPTEKSSAYSVSKGAGRVLTRAMVADLGHRCPDIVISDWMPGILRTKMGRPDGLDPVVAARWGVELALWHDPSLNGTVWVRDQEQAEPRSLRQRLTDLLRLSRPPVARVLGD